MALPTSAIVNGTNTRLDIAYANGDNTSIRVALISAIDRQRNVVIVYHSGEQHMIRFDTEVEAVTLFDAIKALIG